MPKIVKPKARHAADIRRWQPDPVAEVIAFDRQTVRRSGHVGALPGTEIRIEVKMKLHHQRLGKRDRSFSCFGLGGALEYFPRIEMQTPRARIPYSEDFSSASQPILHDE